MQSSQYRLGILAVCACAFHSSAGAQVVSYTDEAAFLAALQAQSLPVVHEGFENDVAWGAVRTPATAPSVHSKSLTWMANNAGSELTTGLGAARGGQFGIYQLPHGNGVVQDGWIVVPDSPLRAIGGWVRGSHNSRLAIFFDGVEVNFTQPNVVGSAHSFFGAISATGFQSVEFRETEAAPGDWKIIFADDFSFAFGGTLIDCNQNGVGDTLDISIGTSLDCDSDGRPDECQIDAASSAPGGPYFCTTDCATDCNANGLLDSCEAVTPHVFSSGAMSPFGTGSSQSFTIPSPPLTLADVLVEVRCYANLGGPDEYVDVRVNGTPLWTLFVNDGDDCPEGAPTTGKIVIPQAVFNNLAASGAVLFELLPSSEVDTNDCDNPSTALIDVTVFGPSALDADGNGVLDSCEGFGTTYCVAAPNSVHAGGAHVFALGSSVVSDNNFTLRTSELPPQVFGLHYFGPNQIQTPVGDGFRCVGGTTFRLGVTQTDSNGVATTAVDLNSAPAAANLLPGTTRHFQFWYRDTAGGPAGFNFSDGVTVSFQ